MQNKILDPHLIFHKYAMQMHKYSNADLSQKNKVSCSIVGARGYSGLELARLLLSHPSASLDFCFASADFKLSSHLSTESAAKVSCGPASNLLEHLTDVVFFATPAEVSMELAPKVLEAGRRVIDLSGAFRLKKSEYEKWYGFEHTQRTLLGQAHYGLLPWATPSENAKLIANPGCYATAISLALIPLLKENLIFEDSVVIDAKSGTTGAGKKASESQLFAEVDGECLPYKVGRHQHYPEIIENIEAFSGKQLEAHLTTSLLPVRRGIITGIYAQLKVGKTSEDIDGAFRRAYGDYPLLKFGNVQKTPELLSLKKVVGTGNTHVAYEVVGQKVYIFSSIDNLLKGAASQAIENFNALFGFPINTGLNHLEALT
ncbi:MAG: N-acetyl-gamma-glutamyl-phosphate reductase [Bdellovibrionaceae bacterium]|nr:N-acetyl-gamma-glutamyl-phosphate reductase [Pseudobdellovibrionaceae bacterium]